MAARTAQRTRADVRVGSSATASRLRGAGAGRLAPGLDAPGWFAPGRRPDAAAAPERTRVRRVGVVMTGSTSSTQSDASPSQPLAAKRGKAPAPAYTAASSSSSSMRKSWLYLATRSDRAGAPVLI